MEQFARMLDDYAKTIRELADEALATKAKAQIDTERDKPPRPAKRKWIVVREPTPHEVKDTGYDESFFRVIGMQNVSPLKVLNRISVSKLARLIEHSDIDVFILNRETISDE